MNNFKELTMEEMMAVDGGASKTKAQRQAAQTAAKKNMTVGNAKGVYTELKKVWGSVISLGSMLK